MNDEKITRPVLTELLMQWHSILCFIISLYSILVITILSTSLRFV